MKERKKERKKDKVRVTNNYWYNQTVKKTFKHAITSDKQILFLPYHTQYNERQYTQCNASISGYVGRAKSLALIHSCIQNDVIMS